MKQIDIKLLDHLKGRATTWCYLMKVVCVGKYDGFVFGFSGLDEDIRFDDGLGEVLYRSDMGMGTSKFASNASFGVGNAEVTGWVKEDVITQEDIFSGLFDNAEVTIYRINYMRPQDGYECVNFGSFGETIFAENNWRCEFRSLRQRARQPFGRVYSLECDAQYGDERCQKPFVWVDGVVTEVGDGRLSFTASGLTQAEGYFAPGVIMWTGGDNTGKDMDIELFNAGGFVRLMLRMPRTIQVGDTFKIRIDCDKTFLSCRDIHGNKHRFRGQHMIPVADQGVQVPGAYIKRKD